MYFFFVRPPDTIDTLLFFAANAASQAFCGTESKKKRQISVEICRFFLCKPDAVDAVKLYFKILLSRHLFAFLLY